MFYFNLYESEKNVFLNYLFVFISDRSSGLSYKDREERVRQLRERQYQERTQKLEELKEQVGLKKNYNSLIFYHCGIFSLSFFYQILK